MDIVERSENALWKMMMYLRFELPLLLRYFANPRERNWSDDVDGRLWPITFVETYRQYVFDVLQKLRLRDRINYGVWLISGFRGDEEVRIIQGRPEQRGKRARSFNYDERMQNERFIESWVNLPLNRIQEAWPHILSWEHGRDAYEKMRAISQTALDRGYEWDQFREREEREEAQSTVNEISRQLVPFKRIFGNKRQRTA